MKNLLGVLVMSAALMVGSASVALADYAAGEKAYYAGDYTTAFREWKPMAERGNAEAQFSLGNMYNMGRGVRKNDREAAKWHRRAADQGNLGGMFTLGAIYEKGTGVIQDYKEALKWYRKAADQGHNSAQSILGRIYEDGKVTPQDKVLAHMWYNVAHANDFPLVEFSRARVEKTMTAAEIAEAQILARRCMEQNYKRCGERTLLDKTGNWLNNLTK